MVLRWKLWKLWIVLIATPLAVGAQVLDTLPVQRPNQSEGTHFIVGFMQNENEIQPSGLRLRVLIATAYPNTVTLIYPDGNEKKYILRAYETLPLLLPDTLEVRQSEVPIRRAIEVRSELPIAVYAMSSQYTTSDSYAALPLHMWGKEYVVLSLPNDTYGDGIGTPVDPPAIRQSEFMIIAAEDATQVEFRPTVPTEGGKSAGQWHSVTLGRGECYLVKAYPLPQGEGDLSGTWIRANKPITVVSGHVRASVPIGLPQRLDSKDHLVEMLLPNSVLGSSYVTVPFATGGRIAAGDYLRAVAIYPNTRIMIYTEREDITRVLAHAGDTLTLPRVNSPTWWYADKPFALVQYMTTGTIANSIMFDPAMVIAVPIGRYVSRCVFQAPANLQDPIFARQFDRHMLNIICDERARLSVRLDGQTIAATIAPELATQKFRSSGMYWAQIPLSPGTHVLETDSGYFSGVLYGMGYTDSYAHVLGVTGVVSRDTIIPTIAIEDSCGNISGVAQDHGGAGLAYVVIEPDSSHNYTFRAYPTGAGISFRAELVNPYQDGVVAIITRDYAGNGIRYRYRYKAPQVDIIPRPLRFRATAVGQVHCAQATLRNFSFRDTLRIDTVWLRNGNLSAFSARDAQFPLYCLPRREVKVNVCYTARASGVIRDTLIWQLSCGLTYAQPLEGFLPQAELSIVDVDFGDVLVGDSACRYTVIRNSGSEGIVLTSAIVEDSTMFSVDQSRFPIQLLPGDSVSLRVCYSPKDTGQATTYLLFRNDKQLMVRAVLQGRGIRVQLQAEDVDFGLRRVGTRFDTVARVFNRGNIPAFVRFRQQQGDRASFLHSLQPNDTLRIPAAGTVTVPLRFSPQVRGMLSSTFEFIDQAGSVISFSARGIGTLPEISMFDTTVGPVRIGYTKSYTIRVARSGGNEGLTIDTLWMEGPDRAAFRIAGVQSFPIRLAPGDELLLPVIFEPLRVGLHTVMIVVRHDAQPNYIPTTSRGALYGLGVANDDSTENNPGDTTDRAELPVLQLDLEYDPFPHRCSEFFLTLLLQNKGTMPVRLSSAEIIEGTTRTTILSRFPTMMYPKEQLRVRLAFPPPQLQREFLIRITANDTVVLERVVRVTPTQGQLKLVIENVLGSIDSVISLRVGGTVMKGYNTQLNAVLQAELPELIADYGGDSDVPVLLRCDGSVSITKGIVALQYPNKLRVAWQIPRFVDTCTWTLALPIRLLYSIVPSGIVRGSFSLGECYRPDSTQATIGTKLVCGHTLRGVQLGGIKLQKVTPNPLEDIICVELDVYTPQTVQLLAYSLHGQRIMLGQERLDVGHRVIIFETKHLSSGLYSLVLLSADGEYISSCCYLKQ
ncbi:MAG: choice-of-anchor D domain-containing protein [Candidatus Kapabacteria bacterium]|nr:choice-of-anchor D domain-containing protein [Candidatus Kapabacteria bacterium]